ncbi:ABC transporter substrate-binding protein [Sediminispirochaeta smaragdinae]|uniref:Aliphatic sulfonates family ABC transporter, periplasmic ligand-binding protein n=1 Tax=Sediminispirochaeta smaragdinae (strain DSM 11293 / JCM 15392 / SEBR 4228) TaxID=573413 RepID=E1R7T5_SEDSS|nr:NrtA/SsuA/CpmA family ABC transporter substrate-binding protein [Sediminispirochaeta smaragdinae]ADK82790.1 aliphatic sulfonates family ABC transporter, periplasmic ligand-binding protein [Sediminispirochaeta smaragdinae DSM 11293]
MKKLYAIITVMALLVPALYAGGSKEDSLKTIDVSYVKSPFNLPLILMKEKGMLEEAFADEGVKVAYHEITSGAKQAEAMAADSLDIGGVMNTTSVLLARSAGNDVRIIAGFSRPVDVFAIVAMDPGITSIADLKGKKVGGPKGTVLHQLLAAALDAKGYGMNDVDLLEMGLPQASTAMLSGQIDAALLAGSLLIQAQKSGAHVITTAKGYVTPKLVIAARGKFLDEHPEAVERYLEVHRSAMAWMEANLDEALEIGAREQGISVEDAAKLYHWTQYITALTEEDVKTMEDDVTFMVENGMLREAVDPRSCISDTAFE